MSLLNLPDRTIVKVNDAFTKTFGYSHDELVMKPFHDADFFIDMELHQATLAKLQKEGRIFNHELRMRTKTGSNLNVLLSAELVRFHDQDNVLLAMIDVTDRKEAETNLRISEERNALTLNATGEGIWDWDVVSGIVRHNNRWCEMIGLDISHMEHPIQFLLSTFIKQTSKRS